LRGLLGGASRRGLAAVLICALLAVTAWVGPAPVTAAAPETSPQPLDIGPEVRDKVLPIDPKSAASIQAGRRGMGVMAEQSDRYDPVPGTERMFLGLDYVAGRYYFKPFVLRGVSENAEVWVAKDLSFPEGDPRNDRIEVTDEQVQYLLEQYESNIRPKEIEFFGSWDEHDGSRALLVTWGYVPEGYYQSSDGKGRDIILVDNVIDENYTDPTYPSYVAGFYSSTLESYIDRNIVTIDNFDWAQRLGPNDAPWRRDPNTGRPYLYEGTLAHELQHLIHDDHDPDEDNFINEGMADFAEFLVGYGHPDGHVSFYLDNPENSLTGWSDQGDRKILADYGLAYLFILYLHDHFGGGPFLQALVAEPANGSQGVDRVLAAFGHKERFVDVYRDFNVALLADGFERAPERYQFRSIDLRQFGSKGGLNLDAETFGDGQVPGWGTDFMTVWRKGDAPVKEVRFNGLDYLPTPWSVVDAPAGGDGKALWSGTGNLLDNWLVLPADLTGASTATLSFDHYYDIEEAWDYGFVQVSTDGGKTWQSLANENTTDVLDPNAHPRVKENVPGFSGASGGWRTERFDLSPYAGRKILLAFRYVTDWASAGNDESHDNDGWFIDNIRVEAGGATVVGPFDGSSLEGFSSLYEAIGQPVQYLVTVVELGEQGKVKVREFRFKNKPSQEDLNQIRAVLGGSGKAERKLVLVSHAAPDDSATTASYEVSFGERGGGQGSGKGKGKD